MEEKSKDQRGIVPEPAEQGRDSQQHEHKAKEGDYRNAETRTENASNFDDDYEVDKENEIAKEEAKTEDNNGRNKR